MEKVFNNIVSRFSSITPWGIFDIFVLSVLFYSVYRFTRRRRAFTALVGMAVFVGLGLAVKVSGLSASSDFFDFFYRVGAIVPVVLFQADIRVFLEKIGGFFLSFKSNVVKLFCPKSESAEAEAIIKAVTRMSSAHTGALIVLERNTGFDEISERGVLLDSLISTDLICNMFYSPAPLHDGAIVIRGKRIHSAACMLPNYTDPSISSSFGSRHRAAIGMSRSSDAGVIVVSEEDGRISYASDGELHLGIDSEKLRSVLEDYYGVKHSLKTKKSGKL